MPDARRAADASVTSTIDQTAGSGRFTAEVLVIGVLDPASAHWHTGLRQAASDYLEAISDPTHREERKHVSLGTRAVDLNVIDRAAFERRR
jgi:hypothetical protein